MTRHAFGKILEPSLRSSRAPAIIGMISVALLLTADLWPCCFPQVVRTLTAGLQGTVTDINGKPPAGVAVNYRNLERNLQSGTLTTAKGQYRISYYPGPYLIEAKLRNLKRWVREGIIRKDNETQQLDIVLAAEGSAAAVNLRPEDYIQRALEAVRKNLEHMKKAVDRIQISVIGQPIVRPDRAAHLSKVDAKERVAVDVAPDALVLIKLRDSGQFRSPALVAFRDQQAEVTFYDTDPLRYPMDEGEWSLVAKELEPFYKAASEINRGPERFDPFLQQLIRATEEAIRTKREQSPPGLSINEIGRFNCLFLDSYSLMNWLGFEGLEPDDSFVRRSLTAQALKSDPRKANDDLAKGVEEWRNLLQKSGALEPDHLRSASAYMRRKLGEGLLFKESNSVRKWPWLPESATLYSAPLIGRIKCHVIFSRIDGQLQIVGIIGQ